MEFKDWGDTSTRGRKPILTFEQMEFYVKACQQTPTLASTEEDISALLLQERKQRYADKGIAYLDGDQPSKQACQNYITLLSCHQAMSIIDKAIQKTNTRHTAENSIRSTMSFLHTIATTHYIRGYHQMIFAKMFYPRRVKVQNIFILRY